MIIDPLAIPWLGSVFFTCIYIPIGWLQEVSLVKVEIG
jgi:hypothetical protein